MNMAPPIAGASVRRCAVALIGTFCGLATAALLMTPHAFLS